jgi:hypothetical protein
VDVDYGSFGVASCSGMPWFFGYFAPENTKMLGTTIKILGVCL